MLHFGYFVLFDTVTALAFMTEINSFSLLIMAVSIRLILKDVILFCFAWKSKRNEKLSVELIIDNENLQMELVII